MWFRHRILVSWAQEACQDSARIVLDPDPASRSGRSLRVIGLSRQANSILVVILVRQGSTFFAATSWRANEQDRRMYERRGRRYVRAGA